MVRSDFEGQHDNEELLFIFRRHLISMRKGFYAILLGAFIGSVVGLILAEVNQYPVLVIWGLIVGLIIGGTYLFFQWISWYFSIFIVTNERIRQSSQKGLFGKSVIDLNLNNVQNISYNMPGFTGELFGFGTIVLQTMVGDMIINKVEHVEKNYNRLSEAIRVAGPKFNYRDNLNSDRSTRAIFEEDGDNDV